MTEGAQMLYICPSPCILFWKPAIQISHSPATKGVFLLPGGFRVHGSSLTSWRLQQNGSANWSMLKFIAKQSWDYFSPGSIPQCSSLGHSTHSTIEGVVWEENDLHREARKQEIIKSVFCGTQFVPLAIQIWNPPCDNPFYFGGVLKWMDAKLVTPQRVQMTHVLQSLQSL